MKFKKCEFSRSSDGNHFPKDRIPHFALVGRSNVGKSSFINYLFRNQSLAQVSSTPGKTRLINFFYIDDKAFLVDLPGYGYAKRGKQEIEKWGEMLAEYFLSNHDIHFIHLLDIRHPPSKDDHLFLEWLEVNEKKPLFLFTKIDKIKKSERKAAIEKLLEVVGEDADYIPMTVRTGEGRAQFIRKLSEIMLNGKLEDRHVHMS